MKCLECNLKFKTKGAQRCPQAESHVCDRCAHLTNGHHRCTLRCPNAKLPEIDWYPVTSGFVGWGTGMLRSTIEEFLPRGLHYLSCEVLSSELQLVKPSLIRFTTTFTLTGDPSIGENLYSKEGWKLMAMQDTFERYGGKLNTLPSPIFNIFLSGGARVEEESVTLLIDGQESLALPNDAIDLVALPDSYPPQRGASAPLAPYSYFLGKSTMFYAPLVLGATYKLSFSIESHGSGLAPGLLYPFRFVDYAGLKLSSAGTFSVGDASYRVVRPIRETHYPHKQQHNWNKQIGMPMEERPIVHPADPLRSVPLVGATVSQQKFENGAIGPLVLDDYQTLQIQFGFVPPSSTKVYVDAHITDRPIPVRIYQQMQRLPRYRDFLISFDLANYSEEIIELEICSEIAGYTDQAISNVTLYPYQELGPEALSKPWWNVTTQCPLLKLGALDKVTRAQEATIKYEVYQVNGERKLIKRGTQTVKLLSRDMIIWSLKDQKSGMNYDLSSMLGAWVSPTDIANELDRVRGGAKKYHPDGVLVGMQSNMPIEDQSSQVKALYDYLDKDEEIRYVNHAFAFNYDQNGQRILTPESVLKTRSGNCIDLTILMASLLEGLGINPLIMLIPGHAFLGWGNPHNTREMGVVECTVIGNSTFEEAQKIAQENFRKHFFMGGWDETSPTPNSLLMMSPKKSEIVSLEEVRREGVSQQVS